MPRRSTLPALLIVGLTAGLLPALSPRPALAQAPNLISQTDGLPGTAHQLVLAQRLYLEAAASADPILLLAAIRMARGVTLRPAPGWTRVLPDGATDEAEATAPGPIAGPGTAAALAALQGMAADDPDLLDLSYDLDAQYPQDRTPVASMVEAAVAPDSLHLWRLPLSGATAAELALVGDGALQLTVTDEAGATVCAAPASAAPALCAFTPARNGFFQVEIRNPGTTPVSYRLIGN